MLRVFVRFYLVAVDNEESDDGMAFDPQVEACNDSHSCLEKIQDDPMHIESDGEDGYVLMPQLEKAFVYLEEILDHACAAEGVRPLSEYLDFHAFDATNPYGHRPDTEDPEEGIQTLDVVLRRLKQFGPESEIVDPKNLAVLIAECEDCRRRLQIIREANMTFLLRVVDLSLV